MDLEAEATRQYPSDWRGSSCRVTTFRPPMEDQTKNWLSPKANQLARII